MSTMLRFFYLTFLCHVLYPTGLIYGAEVPLCKSVSYASKTIYTLSGKNVEFFSYTFDLNFAYKNENLTFPNGIDISNLDYDYTRIADHFTMDILHPPLFSFGDTSNIAQCYDNDDPNSPIDCSATFPNGIIHLHFAVFDSNSVNDFKNGMKFFVNNGYIFDGNDGSFLTEDNACRNEVFDIAIYYDPADMIYQTSCCTKFDYINIPDFDSDFCTNFQSQTTIKDVARNIFINFVVDYKIQQISTNQINIKLNFSMQKYPNFDFNFAFGPNNNKICNGNANKLNVNCTVENITLTNDWQFEFLFSLNNSMGSVYEHLIVGELIQRNKVYMKNLNISYSRIDPCWNKNGKIPFSNGIYETRFCCKNFKESGPLEFLSSTTSSTLWFTSTMTNLIITEYKIDEEDTTIVTTTETLDLISSTIFLETFTNVSPILSNPKNFAIDNYCCINVILIFYSFFIYFKLM